MFYTFKLLQKFKIGRSQPAQRLFLPNRPLGWALLTPVTNLSSSFTCSTSQRIMSPPLDPTPRMLGLVGCHSRAVTLLSKGLPTLCSERLDIKSTTGLEMLWNLQENIYRIRFQSNKNVFCYPKKYIKKLQLTKTESLVIIKSVRFMKIITWATTWQNQQKECASSEDCPHEESRGP